VNKIQPRTSFYNIPALFRFHGYLDINALQKKRIKNIMPLDSRASIDTHAGKKPIAYS
jgi:hypothetical protein